MERPTSGVGPDGGLANEPRKNRAGRQATGILKLNEPVPGVLLPCSFDSAIVRGPEAPGDRARHRPFSSLFAVLYRRVPRPLVIFESAKAVPEPSACAS